jgi:hypothetical protein
VSAIACRPASRLPQRTRYAPSFTAQVFLRRRFPDRERSGFLALGNTSQEKADGRQMVGRRLPILSHGPIGRTASAGRLSERIVHGNSRTISFLMSIRSNIEMTQYTEECRVRPYSWSVAADANCQSATSMTAMLDHTHVAANRLGVPHHR